MRKLAFEHAGTGAFEMPNFRMVNLEKENSNIAFAGSKVPKTVYKGSGFSYGRAQALRAALDLELENTGTSSQVDVVTPQDLGE